MIGALSFTPYYHYTVQNWKEKKDAISNKINFNFLQKTSLNEFKTDLNHNKKSYRDDFLAIFDDEMQNFGKDIGAEFLKIEKIWTVEYNKFDYHDVHKHADSNFTGILYLDFNQAEHSPTYFVLNDTDPFNKNILINYPRNIKEGDIIIVSSNLLHYTKPNKSNKPKRIISFDIIL